MKNFILFLSISSFLMACRKHQDPIPTIPTGNSTSESTSTSIDFTHPKKSTFKYLDKMTEYVKIHEYEYYTDGSLRKIIKYDSLQKANGDSILFIYTDGWLTKKISYLNGYNTITTELFTYNIVPYTLLSTLESYTQINPNNSPQSKKYKYYYDSNEKVSYVLAFDYLNDNLVDSISIVGNTAIEFLGKGEINPYNPNDPALYGYRERFVAHYFITTSGNYPNPFYGVYPDLGLITFDPADLTHQHPIYTYGLNQLNNTAYSNEYIPFQNELSIDLMPDGIISFPEAAFFNKQVNSAQLGNYKTYLFASNDIRYRECKKDSNNNLLFFEDHYFQKIVGRGSVTPESSRTTLYY